MNEVVRDANVYFLPVVAAAPAPSPTPSICYRLRARVNREIWRVRFAAAGIRMALRRPCTPLFADADATMVMITDRRAELIERGPRMSPASVIDFSSARARLRPIAAAR